MKKTLLALLAAATIAISAAPDTAQARWGHGGGFAHAGGFGGRGFIGHSFYRPYYPYYGYGYGYGPYYPYAYRPVAYYGPRCYVAPQRFFDGYGWRVRRVRTCY